MSNGRKGLSFFTCIMIAIGGMVGSSIFSLSGVTYAMAGPATTISWLFAGLILWLYALNLSELATAYPRSGGIFIYPFEVIGGSFQRRRAVGFLTAWSWLNVTILGAAFSAITITTYLQELFPVIKENPLIGYLLPVAWIWVCFGLNAVGTKVLGRANGLLTFLLLAFCLAFFVFAVPHIMGENFIPFFAGYSGVSGMITGIPVAMLAFGSIVAIASLAGEIEKASSRIPKIIAVAIVITISLYLLILIAVIGLAPATDFVADPGRQYYPLSYALMQISSSATPIFLSLVTFAALIAITTTMLVLIADASRTVMALAQNEVLPTEIGVINKKTGTPIRALVVVTIIVSLIALKPDWIWLIINTGSVCFAITVIILSCVLIVFKSKKNQLDAYREDRFHVPGGHLVPILTIVVVLFTLVLLAIAPDGLHTFKFALLWYVIGAVIFIVLALTYHRKNLDVNSGGKN